MQIEDLRAMQTDLVLRFLKVNPGLRISVFLAQVLSVMNIAETEELPLEEAVEEYAETCASSKEEAEQFSTFVLSAIKDNEDLAEQMHEESKERREDLEKQMKEQQAFEDWGGVTPWDSN